MPRNLIERSLICLTSLAIAGCGKVDVAPKSSSIPPAAAAQPALEEIQQQTKAVVQEIKDTVQNPASACDHLNLQQKNDIEITTRKLQRETIEDRQKVKEIDKKYPPVESHTIYMTKTVELLPTAPPTPYPPARDLVFLPHTGNDCSQAVYDAAYAAYQDYMKARDERQKAQFDKQQAIGRVIVQSIELSPNRDTTSEPTPSTPKIGDTY